jgi:surfeit locus 1 family protein
MLQTVRKNLKRNIVPVIAFLVVLPILISLGFWQLDRARQKQELQAMYDTRMNDTPVSIGERLQAPEELQFYRVEVKGYYDTNYTILLDNRVHEGQVGYFVVTPLRIAGSQTRVLVNRGWVPLGEDRSTIPETPAPKGLQYVVGIATVPHAKVFRLAPPPALTSQWQPVWQHMNMKRFAEAVSFPLQPVVVLLDPESEAGGFVRQWKRLDTGIAVHQGYAFQWFSLAVALCAIFLFFVFGRSRERGQSGKNITS